MAEGEVPLKYLGCPLSHVKKNKEHYEGLLDRVKSKLQVWKGKMLSYGGKEVLIRSMLQSIPIYILSTIISPKNVIKD